MKLSKFVAVAGELKTEYRIYSYVNDDELIGIDKVKSDGFFNEAYYQLCLGDKIAVFDHTGILVWLEVSYCDKGIVKTTEISTGGATGGGTNAGIKGDYFATWGWMEGEGGLPTIISGGNNIKIPAGIIMMCPGTDGYITFTGDTTYVNELTEDFTVFYARNIDGTGATFLGATNVIWSDTEPAPNGKSGFQAWKKSGSSNWRLRSNDTDNTWREVVGGPIADVHYTDGNVTRLDFDGYRQFNKQLYATKSEFDKRTPSLPTATGNYVLKATVDTTGVVITQWVKEA